MKNKFLLLFLILCNYVSLAQTTIGGGVVNRYAQVTSITGNTLALGSQAGAAHTWAVGDYVMVIQMTGATEAGGGLYQIQRITAINGNNITINGSLRAYDSPSAEKIQAVWLPYSCNGFTTTGTITAQPWNGLTGGIVALKSNGNIALNGAVSADYAGFRPIIDTQTVYGAGLYGGGGSGAGSGGGGGGYGVPTGSITPQNSGVGLSSAAGGGGTGSLSAAVPGDGMYGGGGSGGGTVQGYGGTYSGGIAPIVATTNANTRFAGGGGGGSYGGGGGGAGIYGEGGGGASPAQAGAGGSPTTTFNAGAINGIGWQNGSPNGAGGGGMFTGGGGGVGVFGQVYGGDGGGYIPAAGYKNYLNTTDPRLFMGGSGSNNGINGGGIVFIDATTMSALTNYTISANGANGNVGGTFGTQAFGGAAGGNIVITPTVLNPITVSAIGGDGILGGISGANYPNPGSGGGGGGGIWVGGSSGGSNINALAANPTVSNVTFNVKGGVSQIGLLDPKNGRVTAGGGGEGIIVADPNIYTAFTKSIGFGTACAGVSAPVLGTTTKSNICPATTVNLMTGIVTSTCPTGTTLEWHTTNVCLDATNLVSVPTAVGAGVYYAVCYDAVNMCYGTASVAETVTITNPCPVVDLTTVITPTPLNGTVGSNSTYNVAVNNVGALTSSGTITETVTLPAGVNYVSGGGNGWTLVSQVGQVLTFANSTIGLSPGSSTNFPIVVSPTTPGTFNTNALVSGGNDSNLANNTAGAVLIAAGIPDLTTTITPPSATTVAGSDFNYTVNVNNIGTGPSVGSATETVTLPAGLTYVSGGGNGWNLVSQNGQVLTFTNTNPALATGGTTSFPLVVKPSSNGTYTTPVSIANGGEVNTTNNTSSAVLTATPVLAPDLTTLITPATGTGTAGVPYNYTVAVSNVGNAPSTGAAQEVITLPAGLSYVSGGGNGWNLISQVGQVLTFANPSPNLASYGSTTFPLVVTPSTSGTYTTPAVVSGGGETNTTNNNTSAVLVAALPATPDLTTVITPASATTTVGTQVNYTVTATNVGQAPTSGSATQTITLPTGLSYISGGGNGWTLSSQNGQVLTFTNTNPNLAVNGTSSFPMILSPTATGTYTTPDVVAGGGETNTTNNTSSTVLVVSPALVSDLTTVITPASATTTVGVPVNYTVTATNLGQAPTLGSATQTITVPAGMTYVSGGGNGWVLTSQNGQVLTFTNSNPNLAVNGTSSFPMVLTPTAIGTYTTPDVVAGGGETNTTNNSASAVLTVGAALVPDLTTVITPANTSTTVGSIVNYTVTATNVGQAPTSGPATQTITIPAGLNYVSGGGNGWVLTSQVGQVLTFTNSNPSLAVNGTSSFPMQLSPSASGSFSTLDLVAGGSETNTTNNSSNALLTVTAALMPDVTTVITPSNTSTIVGTPVNYSVTATNVGQTATVGAVTQTITVPNGLTYVSGGGNGWVFVSQVGQVITFSNPSPNLAISGSSTFPMILTPSTTGTFTTNDVVAGGSETNTSNNNSSAILVVNSAPIPDLITVISPANLTTTAGSNVNYSITATNIGQATSVGAVTQTITLPTGLTYVSGGGNGWNLSSQNGQMLTFTNQSPNLAVNGTSSFSMVVTPTTSGTYTTPVLISGGGETNTSNNNTSAVLVVTTAAAPDLTTSITPSTTTGTAGSPINYTITATNIGTATTSGSLVQTVTMPAGMTYTSGANTNGWVLTSQNGQVLTFTNTGTTLAPNASSSFPMVLTPTSAAASTLNVPVVVSGGSETNTTNNTATGVVNMTSKIALLPKVWLQGSLIGVTDPAGVMRDDLRALNLIPTTSPYPAMGWSAITPTGTLNSSVLAVTGNNAITDWVWVELRSASNNTLVVDSRSALVQRDGDIVDLDGVSNITFNSATAASYYVVVKHRNHLGVMTQNPVALSSVAATVDFRTATTPTYTLSTAAINQAQVVVNQGMALWAGNSLVDKSVIYQGTTNDVNQIYTQMINAPLNSFLTPYYIYKNYNFADVNMNGNVIFQGTSNDPNYIYQNVINNHPGNSLKVNYFIIREQLP